MTTALLIAVLIVLATDVLVGVGALTVNLALVQKTEVLMAAVDDLNAAVAQLSSDVADLSAEVASIPAPAPAPDLSGAIAGVNAADGAVKQASADLKAKFPA